MTWCRLWESAGLKHHKTLVPTFGGGLCLAIQHLSAEMIDDDEGEQLSMLMIPHFTLCKHFYFSL